MIWFMASVGGVIVLDIVYKVNQMWLSVWMCYI